MKSTYSIAFLLMVMFLAQVVQAQQQRPGQQLQQRLTQAKLIEIQQSLGLSDAKLKELAPIYKRYEAEIQEVHRGRKGRILRANPDSLTAEEADRIIENQLESAVKISTIRKRYYPEFKAVLTPQQVMKLYQTEAKIRRKVMEELRRRFGRLRLGEG